MDTFLDVVRAGDMGKLQPLLAEDPSLAGTTDPSSGLSVVMLALYHRHPDVAGALARANGRSIFTRPRPWEMPAA